MLGIFPISRGTASLHMARVHRVERVMENILVVCNESLTWSILGRLVCVEMSYLGSKLGSYWCPGLEDFDWFVH